MNKNLHFAYIEAASRNTWEVVQNTATTGRCVWTSEILYIANIAIRTEIRRPIIASTLAELRQPRTTLYICQTSIGHPFWQPLNIAYTLTSSFTRLSAWSMTHGYVCVTARAPTDGSSPLLSSFLKRASVNAAEVELRPQFTIPQSRPIWATVQGTNSFVCVCINMYNYVCIYIYIYMFACVACSIGNRRVQTTCRHVVPKDIDHLFSDLHTGL